MIFMGDMLEKWPNKGQEYLKYMSNVRLAASRRSGTGWAAYDEQYRLRIWLTFVLSKSAYLAGVETCKSHSSISMSPHGV
jgi:hypothetical protein